MMIDEQVTAAVVAIMAATALLLGFQTIYGERVTESFSELAILGPNMKIGDYPRELIAGENFTLYLYVGNHEGHISYYRALIKIGNKTTTISEEEPMDKVPIASYEVILLHGGNLTRQITLSITEPGINKRLVFELWIYKTDTHQFEYYGKWCQLWLNITAPT